MNNENILVNKITAEDDYEIGDIANFGTEIINNGSTSIDNVIFTTSLPDYFSFKEGSIYINDKLYEGSSTLNKGIILGTLDSYDRFKITFRAECLKKGNSITLSDDISYSYVDEGIIKTESVKSNDVVVNINNVDYVIQQTTDSPYRIGSTYTITIKILNMSEKNVENFALVYDLDKKHLEYIKDSITINGVKYDKQLEDTIRIDVLGINILTTITFQVKAIKMGTAVNVVEGIGAYVNDFETRVQMIRLGTNTNIEIINSLDADFDVYLSTNKDNITLKERGEYTLTITNIGGENINDLKMTDELNQATKLIPNSVTINDVKKYIEEFNDTSLGSLNIGEEMIICFEVEPQYVQDMVSNSASVTAIYDTKKIAKTSNNTNINIIDDDNNQVSLMVEVDSSRVKIGNNINFVITLKNDSSTTFENVIINNLAVDYLSIANIKLDNKLYAGDINDGVNIGTLLPDDEHIITFTATATAVKSDEAYFAVMSGRFDGTSYSIDSNVVNLTITSIFELTVEKSSISDSFHVGDVVPFTIKITNTGTIEATSVFVIDKLVDNLEFVPKTIKVNDATFTGNINEGITLSGLDILEEKVITFEAVAKTAGTNLTNLVEGYATYLEDNTSKRGIVSSSPINFDILEKSDVSLKINKTINNANLIIGDTTTIYLDVINDGKTDVSDVVITDIVNGAIDYVPNTLKVDDVAVTGNIVEGVNIGSIVADTHKVVSFNITGVAEGLEIINQAYANYKYIEGDEEKNDIVSSNMVEIKISSEELIELSLEKTSDKLSYKVAEVATFTLEIANLGNTTMKNITVTDMLPSNYLFSVDSVMVNNVAVLNVDITDGISIADIPANMGTTITFEAAAMGVGEDIANTFKVDYTIGNTSKTASKTSEVNYTTITLNETPDIEFMKSANQDLYYTDDEIMFTFNINNISNTDISNVSIYETLSANLEYIENSVTIDGMKIISQSIDEIYLGDISSLTTKVVTFKAVAKKAGEVSNYADLVYDYLVDGAVKNVTITSNVIDITIIESIYPNVSLTKEVMYTNIDIDKNNIFTITITNNSDTDIEDALLTDIIDSAYEYVSGSLQVDNAYINGDIAKGILLSISPMSEVKVSFKVIAKYEKLNIDNEASLVFNYNGRSELIRSNIVVSNIISSKMADINIHKALGYNTIKVGEVDTVTLVITNDGNTVASDIVIRDPIPAVYEYVSDSLRLNDTNLEGSIISGVNIGSINPNESKTITFKIKGAEVIDDIINIAFGRFSYTNELGEEVDTNVLSNGTTSYITDIDRGILRVEKSQDKVNLLVNEDTNITIRITNVGNTLVSDVSIIDYLPSNYELVNNYVMVDGKHVIGDIKTGIALNNLEVNESVVIIFSVKAISTGRNIANIAAVDFSYGEVKETAISNDVMADITTEESVDLKIEKMGLPNKVIEGEYVNYLINIENVGKLVAYNITLMDIFDSRLAIDNIVIDNVLTNYKTLEDIPIFTLEPGEFTLVEIRAKALEVGDDIVNEAKVHYENNGITGEKDSNIVNISIKENINPNVIIKQSVSNNELMVDEVNTFTFTIDNNSDFELSNFRLMNYLTSHYGIINSSIKITRNGVDINFDLDSLNEVITINSLYPADRIVITFNAFASIPGLNIVNEANASFRFTNLADRVEEQGLKSDEVITSIISDDNPNILITKVISSIMETGVINNVKVVIENIGNVAVTNLIIREDLPDGLEFVMGSLIINEEPSLDSIQEGINIDELLGNEKLELSFNVNPLAIDSNVSSKSVVIYHYLSELGNVVEKIVEVDSDIMVVSSRVPVVNFILSTDKVEYDVGDIVNYRLMIDVKGLTSISNLSVKQILLDNYEFVKDSLIINDEMSSFDITTGVALEDISPDNEVIILFQAKAVKKGNLLVNLATLKYDYTLDDVTVTKEINSNEVIHNIKENSYDVALSKTKEKSFLLLGESNIFTIVISNRSGFKLWDIHLSDIVDEAYNVIKDTITINGVVSDVNLSNIELGSLEDSQDITISFAASAIKVKDKVLNYGTISYTVIDESGDMLITYENTNEVFTKISKQPSDIIVRLINDTAQAEEAVASLIDVESQKLEMVITSGTKEEMLQVNGQILDMLTILLKKEEQDVANLKEIIKRI